MKTNALSFWASFIIRTAVSLAEAFLAGNSALSDQQKTDINTLIDAGTKVLADFGV